MVNKYKKYIIQQSIIVTAEESITSADSALTTTTDYHQQPVHLPYEPARNHSHSQYDITYNLSFHLFYLSLHQLQLLGEVLSEELHFLQQYLIFRLVLIALHDQIFKVFRNEQIYRFLKH